jgi:hypothetical protein
MVGIGAAIAIAISGASLICYALMRRSPRRRDGRGSSDGGTGADIGGYAGDSGGHFGWFGGDYSPSDHSAAVGLGDSGGGDSSGGGGDGGGVGGD